MSITEYFNSLGFDHLSYVCGNTGHKCYSDLKGCFVILDEEWEEIIELCSIDSSMIKSTFGTVSYPNKHIPVIIDKLRRHGAL